MAFPIEIFRAYMVPKLHEIARKDVVTFKAWITNNKFKITEGKSKTNFILDVCEELDLVRALAFDINRMACSSFESVVGIKKESYFPQSIGWLVIRLYYAAYFSVQAILRFFGVSCTQLDAEQVRAIDAVYSLYGFNLTGCNTSSAYYSCKYDVKKNKVYGKQLSNTHKDVWFIFYEFLESVAKEIPKSAFLQSDRDQAVNFIFGLRERLSGAGKCPRGNWLSEVRNNVNYAHGMGAWFPYSGNSGDHEAMLRLVTSWKTEANPLELGNVPEKDSLKFVEGCLAVISLSRELMFDLNSINPKSFLANGAIKYLKVCNR